METEDKTVLLDTGYSDIFIKNAAALGKDLSAVDHIVFSHGHDDHTRGLMYLLKDKTGCSESRDCCTS